MVKSNLSAGNTDYGRTLLYCMGFVLINALVLNFISRERYIYFWDYYLYWSKYQNLGSLMMHSPLRALSEVWHTLRHDDYNLMPVLFLMPFRLLFGPGRLAYILAVSNLYVLPSAILCTVFVGKVASREDRPETFSASLITLLTFLLFPQLWIPVFFGYPDAAGIVVIFIVFLLLWRRPVEEMSLKGLVSLGLLLALIVMLRRWYAYWVVAFFMALAGERILSLFPRYRFQIRDYLPVAKKIIITGAVSFSAFFLAATPIAMRMLTTNYADIYSAYRWEGGLLPFLEDVFIHIGVFITVLFVVSLIAGIANKKTRRISVFLLLHFLFVSILFSRVQNFTEQHYYLIIPSVVISISLLMIAILGRLPGLPSRSAFIAGYLVVLGIQFSVVFVPKSAGYLASFALFFPSARHYPLVRNDLGKMEGLLDALEEISHDGKQSIYVIASSIILNDDILRNACRDFNHPEDFCGSILHSSQVDKVHGFPRQFLSATYVVVAEPIQYHLRPEDQRVVGVLAEDVIQAKGIGTAFRLLPYSFTLDNNVKVRIYRKVRPFEKSALEDLQRRFMSYYPEEKDLFIIKGN